MRLLPLFVVSQPSVWRPRFPAFAFLARGALTQIAAFIMPHIIKFIVSVFCLQETGASVTDLGIARDAEGDLEGLLDRAIAEVTLS